MPVTLVNGSGGVTDPSLVVQLSKPTTCDSHGNVSVNCLLSVKSLLHPQIDLAQADVSVANRRQGKLGFEALSVKSLLTEPGEFDASKARRRHD